MKKTLSLFSILLLLLVHYTFAQTIRAKAGLTIVTMSLEDGDGTQYQLSSKLGFLLGATWERPTPISWLSYEGGILLATKGVTTADNEFKINLTYLDFLFNAKATREIGTITAYGTLGTYGGVGIGGKTIEEYEVHPIQWGSGKDFKRTDFGLSFGGGVEFDAIMLGISYNHGIRNVCADSINSAKNRVFSLTLGYTIRPK
jgi:hypothetical protein